MKKILAFLLISALTLSLFACTPRGNVDPEPMPIPPTPEATAFTPRAELVGELIAYLDDLLVAHDMYFLTLEAKINLIAEGRQPIFIAPNAEDRYYVCAYYDGTPDVAYSDSREYTWVAFTGSAFPDEYEGRAYVLSFEITRAAVTQLLGNTGDSILFESFLLFEAAFTDGKNVTTPNGSVDPYIYLCSDGDTEIYHSRALYYHKNVTIPATMIDGNVYLTVLKGQSRDGNITHTADLKYELGDYYERLDFDSFNTQSETSKNGTTTHYYLIPFDTVATLIVKNS